VRAHVPSRRDRRDSALFSAVALGLPF
jgi:hypothetical protein